MKIRVACAVVAVGLAMAPAAVRAQEEIVEVEARAPRADQPLIARDKLDDKRVKIGGSLGVLGFVADGAGPGLGWNARVTGDLSPNFALEGNYVGGANPQASTDSMVVYTSIDGSVRYNFVPADEAFVQPYATAGVGYAGVYGEGGDPLMVTFPLSLGIERKLTEDVEIGARFSYRPAIFDELEVPDRPIGEGPGADTWSLMGHMGGAF